MLVCVGGPGTSDGLSVEGIILCWGGGDHTIITTQHMPHHACILGISATVWVGLVITNCTVHVAAILHHGIS